MILENFREKLNIIKKNNNFKKLEKQFNKSKTIIILGNGGNLAVADHGSIDISRLTAKKAMTPGSGILISSLVNDYGYENWMKEWLKIFFRDNDEKNTLVIGLTSTGNSKNVFKAIDYCEKFKVKNFVLSAKNSRKISNFNSINLNIDYYHNSEVMFLIIIYYLIHSNKKKLPTIK